MYKCHKLKKEKHNQL